MVVVLNKPGQKALLDIKKIISILPHRYPLLLVDKIIEMDLDEGTIVGQKNLTYNEQFFQGHFPEAPIMPGVLVLEALAQTGGILLHQKGFQEKIAVLLNVNNAKFRNPVHPGDILYLHAQGLHFSSKGGKIRARAMVNDKLAVEAEIGFALVERSRV
ncbi:3-hydroxyacyl-ACP dehydratase FabZ [Simkania negevensis]|uniref:3-hydroxyacyl-[acyl-carrier-protein] dehydratase FabZ n=1 Tax=Simkania negevensis TaxID=83561 RepID=A0ABS3ARF6_9BACT|nr:3-hydroxyacyl-ACP dehydratase FabZ [Simkania negevensis]